MKTTLEKKYTSTKSKLLHNLDRLEEMRNGIFRPISIQLAPTDRCNLDCVFCSVKKREMKELKYKDIVQVLKDFKDLGAKTLEITGGGDPTMYKRISDVINLSATDLQYRVGMITNGVYLNKNVDLSALRKLTWLRISLNCLDYVDDIYIDIPSNVTLGFSYVWNEKSSLKMLEKIKEYKKHYSAKYIRIVPDCRNVKFIENYRNTIMPIIQKYDEVDSFFFQEKEYTPPPRCCMGYLKPFINSDGFLYHCSANPLIDLKFNPHFRMGHIKDVKKIWGNFNWFETDKCGECFFKEHNELIEEITSYIEHEDFI